MAILGTARLSPRGWQSPSSTLPWVLYCPLFTAQGPQPVAGTQAIEERRKEAWEWGRLPVWSKTFLLSALGPPAQLPRTHALAAKKQPLPPVYAGLTCPRSLPVARVDPHLAGQGAAVTSTPIPVTEFI